MSKKPIIGINGDFREARTEAGALSWFNAGYYDCVTASKIQTAGNNKARNCPGGLPIMIPPFEDHEDIEAVVDMVDGLVLGGCHLDLDLELAGHDPHPASRTMPSRREMFDRRLCELAVEKKLPVLAIGSGMQLMNLICGGTILRHIPEDFEQPLQHRDPVGTPHGGAGCTAPHRPSPLHRGMLRPGGEPSDVGGCCTRHRRCRCQAGGGGCRVTAYSCSPQIVAHVRATGARRR